MDIMFILAQIFALVACGLNVISMQCKKKKTNIILSDYRQYYWRSGFNFLKGICRCFNTICIWT